jgi:hypothetical protein
LFCAPERQVLWRWRAGIRQGIVVLQSETPRHAPQRVALGPRGNRYGTQHPRLFDFSLFDAVHHVPD